MFRFATIFALLAVLTTPAVAGLFEGGNVLLDEQTSYLGSPSGSLWMFDTRWSYANPVAWVLTAKGVPFAGPGRFLLPSPTEFLFHDRRIVSYWDGVVHYASEPGKGYTELFPADAELGEISPMAPGVFLVSERSTDGSRPAKLIEFGLGGRIRDIDFPPLKDAAGRSLGALNIEVLNDRCTLLYTLGYDDPDGARIRRVNICTGEAEADFASLVPAQYGGSIRQLRSSDVLVANGAAVLQFTAAGSFVRSYEFPGVTHVALNVDGTAFWAAGVVEKSELHFFELGGPDQQRAIPLGPPDMESVIKSVTTSDLVVVGEWRAAAATERRRAARRH